MEAIERVKDIIVENLSCKRDLITLDAKFIDLGADPSNLVDIVVVIADDFDIDIPYDIVFETLREILSYLNEL